MRNFRVLRFVSIAAANTLLTFGGLFAMSTRAAQDAPPPFRAEVRYHFRERIRNAKLGEKSFSAPSHEREALPAAQVKNAGNAAVREIDGSVPHLPYRFIIKLTLGSDGTEILDVNVLDKSGKSVAGFPQSNPLNKAGGQNRQEFEVAIPQTEKNQIEKTVLAKGQVLTQVELVIGVESFPKAN
jgi:hypothetical protein